MSHRHCGIPLELLLRHGDPWIRDHTRTRPEAISLADGPANAGSISVDDEDISGLGVSLPPICDGICFFCEFFATPDCPTEVVDV